MDTLIVPDVEERGLKVGLHALTPRERDVFAIYDLELYYEMEGCFVDHISRAPEKFAWLEDALERIGDLGSLRIVRRLSEVEDETPAAIALCDEYGARKEFRWGCLERYLLSQNIQLRWERNGA
ncbi:MAG TPA: hypothetical protein VKB41_04140 [Steroidobacteraceae bacterium]|nr:hypothetical protein [Steroidobacteraceae bacterium]